MPVSTSMKYCVPAQPPPEKAGFNKKWMRGNREKNVCLQKADPFLRCFGQSRVVKARALDHCVPSAIMKFDKDFDPISVKAGTKILRTVSGCRIGLATSQPAYLERLSGEIRRG